MSNPQLNDSKEPLLAVSGLSQLLDKGKPVVTRGRKASAPGGVFTLGVERLPNGVVRIFLFD